MTESDITIVGQGTVSVTPIQWGDTAHQYNVSFSPSNGWRFKSFAWTVSVSRNGQVYDATNYSTTRNPYVDGQNFNLVDGIYNLYPEYPEEADTYTITNAVATFERIDGVKGIIYSPTRGNAIVYDTGTLRPMYYE